MNVSYEYRHAGGIVSISGYYYFFCNDDLDEMAKKRTEIAPCILLIMNKSIKEFSFWLSLADASQQLEAAVGERQQ